MKSNFGTLSGIGQVIGPDGQVKSEFIIKADVETQEQADELKQLLNEGEDDNGIVTRTSN